MSKHVDAELEPLGGEECGEVKVEEMRGGRERGGEIERQRKHGESSFLLSPAPFRPSFPPPPPLFLLPEEHTQNYDGKRNSLMASLLLYFDKAMEVHSAWHWTGLSLSHSVKNSQKK